MDAFIYNWHVINVSIIGYLINITINQTFNGAYIDFKCEQQSLVTNSLRVVRRFNVLFCVLDTDFVVLSFMWDDQINTVMNFKISGMCHK